MLKYFSIVFLYFFTLNVSAQDSDLLYGKYLLDSLQKLPAIDTADFSIDGSIKVGKDFTILQGTVYYDCNGDECFEARKGLVTSTNDTLPPVFDDIVSLKNDELVLIGLQKVLHIGDELNVIKVYDHFGPMIEQLTVFIENGWYGLLNEAGEVLLPPNYNYIENNEDNDAILAQEDSEWKALDKNALLKRDKEDDFDDWELKNTLLKVQHPESYLWAFFSREGEQLTPYKYDDVSFTSHGDATASIDGYWGMINDEGEEATEIKYDEIRNGMGVTYIGVQGQLTEKYGLVSAQRELTPVKYSKITTYPLYSDTSKEYYWVAKEVDGHWGLLKLRGQPLTEFIYEEIDFEDQDSPRGLLNGQWQVIK